MDPTSIAVGARGEARLVVAAEHTAEALRSGDVPVLGTPAVLALVEEAAVNAVRAQLPDGMTSVGVRVELEHLAPSKVGAEVVATAELVSADGPSLHFECEARDGSNVVARATHRRALVNRDRWLAKL